MGIPSIRERTVGPEGRYGLQRSIGVTPAGAFWHAVDRVSGDPVTAEVLRTSSFVDREVLRAATEALLLLPAHPHVLEAASLYTPETPDVLRDGLTVLDVSPWVVIFEAVEGRLAKDRFWTLSERSVVAALRVLIGTAEGLAALHATGRTHGCVGPASVLVDRTRGALLVDVGLGPAGASGTMGPGERGDVAGLVRMAHELLPDGDLPRELDRAEELSQVLTCLRALAEHPVVARRSVRLTAARAQVPATTQARARRARASVPSEPDAAPTPREGAGRSSLVPATHLIPRSPGRRDAGRRRDRGRVARPTGRTRKGRSAARGIVTLVAAIVASLTVAVGTAVIGDALFPVAGTDQASTSRRPPPPSARAPIVDPNEPDPLLVMVPDVAGVSASEAREILVSADLELAGLVPMAGPPGEVIGTTPLPGSAVVPGEGILVHVGVEPDRLEHAPPTTGPV